MENYQEHPSEIMYDSGLDNSKLHTYQKNKELHLLQMREVVRNSFMQPVSTRVTRDIADVSGGLAGLSSTMVPGGSGQSSPGSYAAVKSVSLLQGIQTGAKKAGTPRMQTSDHSKQPSFPQDGQGHTKQRPRNDPFKFTFNPCPQPGGAPE